MNIDIVITCDKCSACEKLTFSPTSEAKWCCFCGAKLEGDEESFTVGREVEVNQDKQEDE